jgi:hypothetical protein
MFKKLVLTVLALLVVGGLWLFATASGWLGSDEEPGEIHAGARVEITSSGGTHRTRTTASRQRGERE